MSLIFIVGILAYAQKPEKNISAEMNLTSKFIEIKGSQIHKYNFINTNYNITLVKALK